MKIYYRTDAFDPRKTAETELPDDIAEALLESYRKEDASERRYRRHTVPMPEPELLADRHTPEELFGEEETRGEDVVRSALKELPEKHRERLMRYARGQSPSEIALLEGASLTNVYRSLRLARHALRAAAGLPTAPLGRKRRSARKCFTKTEEECTL